MRDRRRVGPRIRAVPGSARRRPLATAGMACVVGAALAACGSTVPSGHTFDHAGQAQLANRAAPAFHAVRRPAPTPTPWPAAGPCPRTALPELPRDSGCASRVNGDFDGDGRADQFVVYASPLGPDRTARAWHIMVVPAHGKPYSRNLDMWPGADNKGVVAALDVNRDGRAEALVLVHQGADTDLARLFELRNARILPIRGPSGTPFEFATGGSVLEGSGGGCRMVDHQPVIYTSGYFEKAHHWHWTETAYGFDGDRGLRVSRLRTSHGLTTERRAESYGQFTCYSLHLGQTTRPKIVY